VTPLPTIPLSDPQPSPVSTRQAIAVDEVNEKRSRHDVAVRLNYYKMDKVKPNGINDCPAE